MKCSLLLPAFFILFASCKKVTQPEQLPNDMDVNNGNIAADVQPAPPYTWKSMTAISNGNVGTSTLIQSGNNVYCVVSSGYAYKYNNTTKAWEPAPVQQMGHFSTGQQYFFSYGGRIYFGMNRSSDSISHGLVSSIPDVANSYIHLARFPGTAVSNPACFVIGDKGYIMGGTNYNGNPINQLWEYNFSTNQWVNKNGSPLGARAGAVTMVVGNAVYMGMGYDHISFNGSMQKRYKKDWVLYFPSSTFFTTRASLPGAARTNATGFVLNDIPFVGFGGQVGVSPGYKDFWKYSPSSNTWSEQQSWTGADPLGYTSTKCFSLGNTGYAVRSSLMECKRFSNTLF